MTLVLWLVIVITRNADEVVDWVSESNHKRC